MKAVIYNKDLEPLTVANVPDDVLSKIEKYGSIDIDMCPPMVGPGEDVRLDIRIVRLHAFRIHGEANLLFINDRRSLQNLKYMSTALLPVQVEALRVRTGTDCAKAVEKWFA